MRLDIIQVWGVLSAGLREALAISSSPVNPCAAASCTPDCQRPGWNQRRAVMRWRPGEGPRSSHPHTRRALVATRNSGREWRAPGQAGHAPGSRHRTRQRPRTCTAGCRTPAAAPEAGPRWHTAPTPSSSNQSIRALLAPLPLEPRRWGEGQRRAPAHQRSPSHSPRLPKICTAAGKV